ncbi:hypothetical protein F1Z12_03400 [Staphylococcus aureus]|uniref:hypothetical protein n=1 Tax=Staphylococcus epidermidis TaxID=1282 RepID=UPI000E07B4C5|nr:hypothetical protein [Staphylococcus epidermidis]MBD6830274.1 hypothetical protein [Staphylococcus aureus]SUM50527.1 Uncharacterised protein [Staphylococcus epidermidis]HCV2499313.1 hypothetical protein [Staphylococcus aureus]HCW9912963.1 hypothetical protein [Staphylococcus aureus]HCY0902249.1 hypothetical protein [Staphylococcus aureus]
MKKLLLISVLFLTAIVLTSCGNKGLEKITLNESKDKITNTKGEYIAYVQKEEDNYEEYKKILNEVSQDKKIYLVELSEEITTSEDYQKEYTAKYSNMKNGIIKTNKGKEISDNNKFDFSTETNIDSQVTDEKETNRGIEKARNFINK